MSVSDVAAATSERRGVFSRIWRQLPFLLWLVAVWMMLWGQFTLLAFVTGLAAAIFVTRIYRLPAVELSGRVNPWRLVILIVSFLAAVVRGSLLVAWQVLRPGPVPRTAVVAIPLRTDDDLIMTHTAVTASLIPGSFVIEADRNRRVLYLHVLGVHDMDDVEDQRKIVLGWEARIVRAVGSRSQLEMLRGSDITTPRQGREAK